MAEDNTYMALQFKGRWTFGDKGSAPSSTCRPVILALGTAVVLLLGTAIAQTILILKGSCLKRSSYEGNNHSIYRQGSPEDPKQTDAWKLGRLWDHLCVESAREKAGPACQLCPNGWLLFRGRCFYFSEQQKSWGSSQEFCSREKSNLLTIEDESEMDLIDSMRDNTAYRWTGLQYKQAYGAWTYLNGSTVQGYRIKVRSQLSDDSCGAYRNREIYQEQCGSSKKWICEKLAIPFDP